MYEGHSPRFWIHHTPLIFTWASTAQKLQQKSELVFLVLLDMVASCHNKNVLVQQKC